MKRLLCLLLAAVLFSFPAATPVSAEEGERYAVAAQQGVWFYGSESEESGLFQIPYTYYVRVLREGTLFSAVQYLDNVAPYRAVTGFCKTEDLLFVDFVPVRPYLRREITVTYNVSGEGSLGSGVFDKIEKKFVYYGESYAGTARFYYVLGDGMFGYVPATQEVIYELNSDFLTPSAGESMPSEPPSAPSAVQVVAICAAVAVLLAIAVFVLRGKRPSPADDP